MTDSNDNDRDPLWGTCDVNGCPLLGTVKRGDVWVCHCHVDMDRRLDDLATRTLRSQWATYAATLGVRARVRSVDWPRRYRETQQRLLDAGRDDLLPGPADWTPYRPGRVVIAQWLARLERQLLDAVQDATRRESTRARTDAAGAKASAPSGECIARMRVALAPLAQGRPSPKWAFDLLDAIARHPTFTPDADAVRAALDATRSAVGRRYFANAAADQRARWRTGLEALAGSDADLLPSREPGEDDEPLTIHEANDDDAQP